jgi:hypothetical protein
MRIRNPGFLIKTRKNTINYMDKFFGNKCRDIAIFCEVSQEKKDLCTGIQGKQYLQISFRDAEVLRHIVSFSLANLRYFILRTNITFRNHEIKIFCWPRPSNIVCFGSPWPLVGTRRRRWNWCPRQLTPSQRGTS